MQNMLGFLGVLSTIWNVILALLILLIMITIHELGHYIAGKIFKFKINEFAIGMGPAIFKRTKKSGEVFSVRALPFGGFCAFDGEDKDTDKDNQGAFNNKPVLQRIIVLVSGALMNFILAFLAIILLFSIYGQSLFMAYEVEPYNDLPAIYQTHSLESGDLISAIEVNGKKTKIYMPTQLLSAIEGLEKGDIIDVYVIRDGKELKDPVDVALRASVPKGSLIDLHVAYEALGVARIIQVATNNEDTDWLLSSDYIAKDGISQDYAECNRLYSDEDIFNLAKHLAGGDTLKLFVLRNNERVLLSKVLGDDFNAVDKENKDAVLSYLNITSVTYAYNASSGNVRLGFFDTISGATNYSFVVAGTIFRTLGELLTGMLGIDSMGGTVTTIVATSEIVSHGFNYFLEMLAFIGINLAVFNLLPLPALDGSRVVFCVIEWIRKKPINRNIEGAIHLIGLLLLLGFAVLVDLLHFL